MVCEEEVAVKALEAWSRIAQPFFDHTIGHHHEPGNMSAANLLPMPPAQSSLQGVKREDRSNSQALAPESYDKMDMTVEPDHGHPPQSPPQAQGAGAGVGASSLKSKHTSFVIPQTAGGGERQALILASNEEPNTSLLSMEPSSVRDSPLDVLPGLQVCVSGSSFTNSRGSHPLKSALRQAGGTTSASGVVTAGPFRQASFTTSRPVSTTSISKSGGSFTTLSRMDPKQSGASLSAFQKQSVKEIEELQEASGGYQAALPPQRLLSMDASIRSMSVHRSSSLSPVMNDKDWLLPSHTLLHLEERLTLVVNRLGTFSFEGCPEPLKMVDLTTTDLVIRRYPLAAPKGKGGRLTVGQGEVGRVQLPMLKVMGQVRNEWVSANMIRVGVPLGDIELAAAGSWEKRESWRE